MGGKGWKPRGRIHRARTCLKNTDLISLDGPITGPVPAGFRRDGGESYDDGSYRSSRRSYRGGYSGHGKEEMIEQMEELMEEAGSEKERQKYQLCLKHLREM